MVTIFFMSFSLLCGIIMLNILIAVILTNFQDTTTGDGLMQLESLVSVTTKTMKIRKFVDKFSGKWKENRKSATSSMLSE